MSIFLKQEQMWDMPLTAKVDEKRITHWCGNLCYVVVGAFCKICFRYRVDHREKLRAFQDLGAVVVCCHTSFLDVVLIYLAARTKQWVRIMGRDSLFSNAGGLMGQILSRVGAFPVKRDAADRTSIKRAAKMLKNGELVAILPEGTRRGKSNRKPELHAGAGFVAKMGRAPLLPMCVRNVEKVKEKGKRFHFPKVTVEYGDPVVLSDFDFVEKKDRLEAFTWYAMRECFALKDQMPAEDVDMAALFPDCKDYKQLFLENPIPMHDAVEYAKTLREQK